MTLILKTKRSKYSAHDQLQVIVTGAVNVVMNEIAYDNNAEGKTFITDGLVTCVAIALYGSDLGFSTVFTHMCSESTSTDDKRKEKVLNEMLEYILKINESAQVKMVIAPSSVEENHLIHFIEQWAKEKNITCSKLSKGGDSAVFNIDETGKALMLTTSLNLEQIDEIKRTSKSWNGKGIVIAASSNKLVSDFCALKHDQEDAFNHNTFFTDSQLNKADSAQLVIENVIKSNR
jgi:hypothetical protein